MISNEIENNHMQSFIPEIQQVYVIYQVPTMMAGTGD